MTFLKPTLLALLASLSTLTQAESYDAEWARSLPPGRADRLFPRQARDFGVFTVDCAGAEGACNNACYYINCETQHNGNPDRITYIGPGNQAASDQNRRESGCQTNDGSVCGNYPFSQKFIDDQADALNRDCDEWPPAVSQQVPFGQKQNANSLRCIPASENRALGARLGNFINDRGGPYPGRLVAGPMARDDYFRVEFDIANADQNKLKFCIGTGTSMCGSDGFQFGMTVKSPSAQGGRIKAPYEPNLDNHYALQNTIYADIFQCSVEFTRDGDNDFNDVGLFDYSNTDVTQTISCSVAGTPGTCDLLGLPNTLRIGTTGGFGTDIEFEYSDNNNVNHYTWTSESTGNGRGPATNDGEALRFCKVEDISNTEKRYQCWFPCYQNANGQ